MLRIVWTQNWHFLILHSLSPKGFPPPHCFWASLLLALGTFPPSPLSLGSLGNGQWRCGQSSECHPHDNSIHYSSLHIFGGQMLTVIIFFGGDARVPRMREKQLLVRTVSICLLHLAGNCCGGIILFSVMFFSIFYQKVELSQRLGHPADQLVLEPERDSVLPDLARQALADVAWQTRLRFWWGEKRMMNLDLWLLLQS